MKKTVKSTLAFFLAFIMVFGAAPMTGFVGLDLTLPEWLNFNWLKLEASAYNEGIYTYEVSSDEATITGCDNSASGAITVPPNIGGYPVTAIGNQAFSFREGLTSVDLPDGVKVINYRAFEFCTNLTNITMPAGLTSVGEEAFYGCNSLDSVVIPVGVTSIAHDAFESCIGLKNIDVDSANTSYASDNGVLYDKNYQKLIVCPAGKAGTVIIPNSVTEIEDAAFFRCRELTGIQIGSGVVDIGDGAFTECRLLENITIPKSVQNLGFRVFGNCDNLINIYVETGSTAFSSENGILYDYNKNTLLTCPAGKTGQIEIAQSVIKLNGSSFYYCTGMTGILLPAGLISIEEQSFYHCSSLSSITIPANVEFIGNDVFSWCAGLTAIYVDSGNMTYMSDNGILYDKDPTTLITCPEGKTGLLTIPSGVLSVGESSFFFCAGLTGITFPSGMLSIGWAAFTGCEQLVDISIPDSVTSIDSWAFEGTAWFNNQPDGLVYAGKVAYTYKGTMDENTVINLREGTNGIAGSAFFGQPGLSQITIPNTVSVIGDCSFYGCSGLMNVTIPNSVTRIGDSAFADCVSLTGITVPNSVTNIGDYAFYNCLDLTSATIPGNFPDDFRNTFEGCENLTCVCINEGSEEIRAGLFSDCPNINNITIPASVTSIGNDAFIGCTGLTSIIIPDSVTSIGSYAFAHCVSLSGITIPNSVTSIGERAFDSCVKLNWIVIPDSITSIGNYMFCDCVSLTGITIPNSVTSIGEGAFAGCVELNWIVIPDSVTSISVYAFYFYYVVIIGTPNSYAHTFARESEGNIGFIPNSEGLYLLHSVKYEYILGETLDLADVELVYIEADGTVVDIAAENCVITGYDANTLGEQTVSISYLGETTSFLVRVIREPYLESAHPYSSNTNQTWTYTHPEPAQQLAVTFSWNTFVEWSGDFLDIYDAEDNIIGSYTGDELAGQTVIIPGNSFSIRLTSNEFVEGYGFRIDGIESINGVDFIHPAAGSPCVIDGNASVIYGLEPGITKEQFESDYVTVSSGFSLQYSTLSIGTGAVVNVVDSGTNEVVKSYTIVIYGDVNGDSNINAIDSDICLLVQNWMMEWDETEDAAFINAGDVNGDGRVDSVDADIITLHENWMVTIDQTTGMAV